jgi:hypothetical protein
VTSANKNYHMTPVIKNMFKELKESMPKQLKENMTII